VDLKPYSLAVGRGGGLVAHTGDVVMYVADATGAAFWVSALDSAAAQRSRRAGALARIASGPDTGGRSPLRVLAPTADGVLMILRGRVAADIEADGASRTLAGDRALTWVDETVAQVGVEAPHHMSRFRSRTTRDWSRRRAPRSCRQRPTGWCPAGPAWLPPARLRGIVDLSWR
jgi:hypothetical protein